MPDNINYQALRHPDLYRSLFLFFNEENEKLPVEEQYRRFNQLLSLNDIPTGIHMMKFLGAGPESLIAQQSFEQDAKAGIAPPDSEYAKHQFRVKVSLFMLKLLGEELDSKALAIFLSEKQKEEFEALIQEYLKLNRSNHFDEAENELMKIKAALQNALIAAFIEQIYAKQMQAIAMLQQIYGEIEEINKRLAHLEVQKAEILARFDGNVPQMAAELINDNNPNNLFANNDPQNVEAFLKEYMRKSCDVAKIQEEKSKLESKLNAKYASDPRLGGFPGVSQPERQRIMKDLIKNDDEMIEFRQYAANAGIDINKSEADVFKETARECGVVIPAEATEQQLQYSVGAVKAKTKDAVDEYVKLELEKRAVLKSKQDQYKVVEKVKKEFIDIKQQVNGVKSNTPLSKDQTSKVDGANDRINDLLAKIAAGSGPNISPPISQALRH